MIAMLLVGNQIAKTSPISNTLESNKWTLVISQDKMRIQKADGSDWFWLGDTGWSLFQELNREEAEY